MPPVYCETDKYIMKHPASIIGFDSTILYEKKGLLEIEKQRYKDAYPQSMIPLDSIGVIVIYGELNNGEALEHSVSVLPLDEENPKSMHANTISNISSHEKRKITRFI